MGTCTEKKYKEVTGREWWIQEIFGKRACDACGDRPIALLAHVSLPESRLTLMDPVGVLVGKYGDPVAYKPMLASERYFMVGQHAACGRCQRAMERMLAQRSGSQGDYGSSAHVTFDRPPTDRLILLAS